PRRRERRAADRKFEGRLQRHRPRPVDRRDRLLHLAGPRPDLRPGPLRYGGLRLRARGRPSGGRAPPIAPAGGALVIKVGSRAHPRPDRAGEPLDGLVNMFDIGIVLAVAFLIAGLQALHLTGALTHGTVAAKSPTIVVRPNQKVQPFKPGS